MIALPVAFLLFGYWVMYAGIKRSSMADAWSCLPQQGATSASQTGSPGVNVLPLAGLPGLGLSLLGGALVIGGDCKPHAGDVKLPAGYVWRPSTHQLIAGC